MCEPFSIHALHTDTCAYRTCMRLYWIQSYNSKNTQKNRTISTFDIVIDSMRMWCMYVSTCEKVIDSFHVFVYRLQCDWMSHAFGFSSLPIRNKIMTNFIRFYSSSSNRSHVQLLLIRPLILTDVITKWLQSLSNQNNAPFIAFFTIIFVLTIYASATQVYICDSKLPLKNCWIATILHRSLWNCQKCLKHSHSLFCLIAWIEWEYLIERLFIDVISSIQTCTKKMYSQLIMWKF